MIRKVIAAVRSRLVGPSLGKLASLRTDQIESLKIFLSEDPLMQVLSSEAKGQVGGVPKAFQAGSAIDTEAEIKRLSATIATLSERVEVLERVLYKQK